MKDEGIQISTDRVNLIAWAGSSAIGGVDVWSSELKNLFKNDPEFRFITISDYSTYSGGERIDINISSWAQLEKRLKNLTPAVVIPNWRHPVFGVCAKLKKNGYRLYTLGICHSDSEKECYEPLAWYESSISKFMAVSSNCREKLCRHIPARKDDLYYLPCGIGIPEDFKKQYSIRPIRLIYFGRIAQKHKNILDLVRLVEILYADKTDFRLDIFGNGPDKDEFVRRMKSIDKNNLVKISPELPHDRMLTVLANYDVSVLTSSCEGQSLSLMESMARKVIPCVTKDSGGSWSVIEYGQSGYFVEIGDMESMAKIIKKISEMDRSNLEKLGNSAYKSAKEHFDNTKIFPEFKKILKRCLEREHIDWAHNDSYIMPCGWRSRYLPYNEFLGYVLKLFFKIISRDKAGAILMKLGITKKSK